MLLKSLVLMLLVAPTVSSAQHGYANFAPALAMSNLAMQPLIHQSNLARAQARRSTPTMRSNPASEAAFQRNSGRSAETDSQILQTFSYVSTAATREAALTGYISRVAKANPEIGAEVAKAFGKADVYKIYRGLITGSGLRDNDAADALTAYTSLGWMVANNKLSNPDPQAIKALRQQIAARATGTPPFASRTRAALGEELKLLFVTLHSGWQGARREGKLREYSDGVTAMFKQQGTDLRAVNLTADGFIAR